MAEKFNLDNVDPRLSKLYTSNKNKREVYDDWAETYDGDVIDKFRYMAHVDAATIFHQLDIGDDARILDVGCGTGLAGKELQRLGYQHLDGTDFSEGMLAIAREQGIYERVFRHDFTQPLEETGRYDALFSVGLFSFQPPRMEHIHYAIAAVKSGGLCVITINGAAWREHDLSEPLKQQAELHGFTVEAIDTIRYLQSEGIDGRALTIRVP